MGSRCPSQTGFGLPLNQLTVVYCTHVRFIMNDLRTRGRSDLGNAICKPESALPQRRTLPPNDLQGIPRDRLRALIYDWQLYIDSSATSHHTMKSRIVSSGESRRCFLVFSAGRGIRAATIAATVGLGLLAGCSTDRGETGPWTYRDLKDLYPRRYLESVPPWERRQVELQIVEEEMNRRKR